MIDKTCLVGGTEAVVDVDDRNAAGAGVEHRKKRCHAAEACAVAHAGRHRNDRAVGKPADDAPASSAAQRKDPTWKGAVIKIDRQNGNSETPFDGIDQLKAALA